MPLHSCRSNRLHSRERNLYLRASRSCGGKSGVVCHQRVWTGDGAGVRECESECLFELCLSGVLRLEYESEREGDWGGGEGAVLN